MGGSSHDSGDHSVSKPGVGFFAGDRPRFSDEIRGLLHTRLIATGVIASTILAIAFVGALRTAGGHQLWWLRVVVLAVLVGSTTALKRWNQPRLSQLRGFEFLIFAAVCVQLAIMMTTRLASYASDADPISTAAIRYAYLAGWCILILTYGIFVPNTWRRGAAVMVPMACMPYAIVFVQSIWSPEVGEALASVNFTSPVSLTLVAALVGIYGTHTINAVRREAFKARQFGQYRLGEVLAGI